MLVDKLGARLRRNQTDWSQTPIDLVASVESDDCSSGICSFGNLRETTERATPSEWRSLFQVGRFAHSGYRLKGGLIQGTREGERRATIGEERACSAIKSTIELANGGSSSSICCRQIEPEADTSENRRGQHGNLRSIWRRQSSDLSRRRAIWWTEAQLSWTCPRVQ